MILKSDLKVVNKGKLYHIYMRKPFLLFFEKWIELTWTDNNKEVPMQFKSFREACRFIDSFAD